MPFCFHGSSSRASPLSRALKTEAVLPEGSTACIVCCGERGITFGDPMPGYIQSLNALAGSFYFPCWRLFKRALNAPAEK
jgi:hypothetical protein